MKDALLICSDCGSTRVFEIPEAGICWEWNSQKERYIKTYSGEWRLECAVCHEQFDEEAYANFLALLDAQETS